MSTTPADLSQPDSAAEQTASDYSAFLGPPSHEPDLTAAESPEPSAEGEVAEPEAEAPAEGQEEAQSEEAEGQPEIQAEAEAEQPPSIQERLKDLTQREQEQYQQRYPSAWKALEDPNTPEDLKHLLLDKIDSDHEIQQRIFQEQQLAEQEPTLEAEQQPEETAPAPAAMTPAQQRDAYYAQIDNLVKTQFDQSSVREFGDAMLRMFNVNAAALNDPNISPEDKQVLQGLVQSVQREAPVLARYMADTVSTVIPHVLPAALEMIMPGFGKVYERQQYGRAWESVRQQTDAQGRPVYRGLPAYPLVEGTPEAMAFSEKLRDAADSIPGFDDMVFRGKDGRVLPMQQQAQLKYQMLAKVIAGQRVNPAVVAEAVNTGRRLAGQADRRRQAGRALGAGQSNNSNPVTRGAAAAEQEDPMMAALDAEIAHQEGNYRQPIRGRQSGR